MAKPRPLQEGPLRRRPGLAGLLLTSAWVLAADAAATDDHLRSFGAALRDPLVTLPRLLDAAPGMVSSFDRSGGNDDGFSGAYSFLRRSDDGEYVIFEQQGPGLVSHLWFTDPAPAQRIRFRFDGEATPRVDVPIRELFRGTRAPFVHPLVGDDARSSGGFYAFVPLPYRRSLRISTTGVPRFYHVSHLVFADAEGVESFDPALDPEQQALLHATAARWQRPGDAAAAVPDQRLVAQGRAALAAGAELVLLEVGGSGIVDGLVLETDPRLDWSPLGDVRLRAFWDGETQPSVSVPLRAFFGAGHPAAEPRALPLGAADGRFYSFFRMPFASGARISIENATPRAVPELRFRVLHRALSGPPHGTGRFHAQLRQQVATQGQPIEILRRRGRGHLVGVGLDVRGRPGAAPRDLLFLEGDEQIYVDGAPHPALHGTGTEDYFDGGWYFDKGTFSLPFHGHPFRGASSAEIAAYRFHVLDPIPYQREIQAWLEHGMGNEQAGVRYRVLAIWYEDPEVQARSLPQAAPPRDERTVVTPPAGADNLRRASLAASGGSELVLAELVSPDLVGTHLLRFGAEGPGSFVELPLVAEVADRYAVRTFHCRGPDQGRFRVELGGSSTQREIEGYAPGFAANVETSSGAARLHGEARVRLVVSGKHPSSSGYTVTLTGIELQPLSRYATRWWVLGPFDDPHGAAFREAGAIERTAPDLAASHPGKHGAPIRWQRVDAEGGLLDFERIFGATDHAVAYALTFVDAALPATTEAQLFVGSDDGVRVYLGRELVLERALQRRFVRDEDRIPVQLRPGRTPILVKVSERVGGWRVSLRISDPLDALSYATD